MSGHATRTPPHTQQIEDFVDAMIANPNDHALRLVLADFLAEKAGWSEVDVLPLRDGSLTGRHPYNPGVRRSHGWVTDKHPRGRQCPPERGVRASAPVGQPAPGPRPGRPQGLGRPTRQPGGGMGGPGGVGEHAPVTPDRHGPGDARQIAYAARGGVLMHPGGRPRGR
jgi:hypothetical protein